MFIARCLLTLHDSLFFATREMGTLFETERFIHNYALSYALFNDSLIRVPYRSTSYRPEYARDLNLLNERGIYVTPACPLQWEYLLITWKIGQVSYYRKPEKFGGRNYPANYGRSKELAPGSSFEFFVFSLHRIEMPRWIRLGKWASKALVEVQEWSESSIKQGMFVARCPLNPIDWGGKLDVYDLISMPPSSLVQNARLQGSYYELPGHITLPAGLRYTFP